MSFLGWSWPATGPEPVKMSTDAQTVVKPENDEIRETNKLIGAWVRRETRAAELVGLEQLAAAADAVDSIVSMSREIALSGRDDVHTYHDSAVTSARCAVCAELAGKLVSLRFNALKFQAWFRTARLAISICANAAEKNSRQRTVIERIVALSAGMTELAQLCKPICTNSGNPASKAHMLLLNRVLGVYLTNLDETSTDRTPFASSNEN